MKTKVMYLINVLLVLKNKISVKTTDFLRLVKDKLAYEEQLSEFELKNRSWHMYSNTQKVRWMFVLFIICPILILVDYTTLRLFISYLQHTVQTETAISFLLRKTGILIFFVMELGICFATLKINETLENGPNRFLKVLKALLVTVMVTLPSILIFTGYKLLPQPQMNDTMRTFALILLSLAIHTALFVLLEDLLRAVTYLVYRCRRMILSGRNPVAQLERIKKELCGLYAQYDVEYVTLSELPDVHAYLSSVKLGRREQKIREKLEDGIDDDDYDEFINTKRSLAPKVPLVGTGTGVTSSKSASVVW